MIENLKKWSWAITLAMCSLLLMGQCSQGRKISSLKKENAKLYSIIDSTAAPLTEKQIRDIVQGVMLDFLIFEDDLDKGKTSLTNIKSKIEKD